MPTIRADIVDLYIFRRTSSGGVEPSQVEFLQLLRSGGIASGAWHPVMGHIQAGETSLTCIVREMHEETGLIPAAEHFVGMWTLEQVHPFFVPEWDAVIMSPRFCAEVQPEWRPALNEEHSKFRWVPAAEAVQSFLWPGQIATIHEITEHLLRPDSALIEALRIRL